MRGSNIGRVTGGRLNLRKHANHNSLVLTNIPDEALLRVIDYNHSWYVTIYGACVGFVMKQYVELLDLSGAVWIDVIVRSGKLNMRHRADSAAQCLVQIPFSNSVTVIDFDKTSQWYITDYEGYTGFVMKEDFAIPKEQGRLNYGQTIIDEINIRKEPDKSAMRWNNVWPENRIALIKYANENWYETLYRGEQAFVSAEFITLLDCKVPSGIIQRMLYMVKPEIGRVNSVYFNGYTGQWCHRFADWLAMHAGTPKNLIPNTSNCGKGIVWFVNDAESGGFYFKNAEHKARMISNYSTIRHLPKELTEEEEAYTPSPGDYIYFRWRNAAKDVNVSHVGIVSSVSDDKLTTVEGNAGGAVANRSYALNDDRIVGYGKPRYDAVG